MPTEAYRDGGSQRVVTIPEDRDEALRRYREEPLFHTVVDIAARGSGFSRNQLLDGEGPREVGAPAHRLGLSDGQ